MHFILTFEVDLAAEVRIEDVDDALHQRVLLKFWHREKLAHADRARVVKVQLEEALLQFGDLFAGEALDLR